MENPKITVVTVCFNAVDSIEETMLSVLNQTYKNIEYIIIDGESTDGTVDIIKKYSDRLAYWISEPDTGIYNAMNKGIAAATGDYINFMNAGDKFTTSNIVNTIVSQISPAVDVLYGDCYYINMSEGTNARKLVPASDISKIVKKYPFCHQATFSRTSYIKNHLFNTSFKICADWNFFRNAFFYDKLKFKHVSEAICDFDISAGMSRDNLNLLYEEKYRCLGISNSNIKKLRYEIIRILINIRNRIVNK